MPYGTIKVDNITFDNGGTDKLITVSGLFFSTSGALTVTGTISGGNVTAPTATFTTLTGTTTAGTTATFTSGSFTSLTGVTTTGTTATFTSGSFTSLTGVTTTVTSGVFGLGSAAAPSIAFSGDTNNGIYSPGADQVAISTSGTGRLFVDASGNIGIATSTPNTNGYGGSVLGIFGSGNNGGNIWLTSETTAAGNRTGRIGFGTEGNTVNKETARIWSLVDGSTAGNLGGNLLFNTKSDGGALTERMRLDSSGRLGLGTSSPGYLVTAATSADGVDGISVESPSSNGVIRLRADGTNGNAIRVGGVGAQGNTLRFLVGGDTERMRIDSSGNVGIGVTPSAWGTNRRAFQIGGNSSSALSLGATVGEIFYNSFFNTSSQLIAATTGQVGYHDFNNNVAGGFTWGTSNASVTAGNVATATTRMTITSGGNVGIGTTSPLYPLDVNGVIYTRGRGSTFGVLFDDWRIYNSTAPGALVFDNGSERARIDSSGRLLVGTSSARSNLTFGGAGISPLYQVESTGAESSISITRNATNNLSNARLVFAKNNSATLGTNVLVDSGEVLGEIAFNGNDGTNFIVGANITGEVDGTPGTNDMPGRLVFSTTADGASSPTERMRLTSAGRLGLGTTSPGTTLDCKGNITLGSQNASAANVQPTTGSGTNIAGTHLTLRAGIPTGSGASGQVQIFPSTSSATGGTSPATDASKGLYLRQQITNWDSNAGLFMLNAVFGLSASEGNRSGLGNDGTVVTIDGANNGSQSALEIVGSSNGTNATQGFIRFFGSGSKNPYVTIGAFTPGTSYTSGNFFINTYNSGTEGTVATFTNTGRLGIGTTSPSYKLHASGTTGIIKGDSAGCTFGNPSLSLTDSTHGVELLLTPISGLGAIGTYTNHPLVFYTNNGERARIDSSGRVGIGTTSPGTSRAYIQVDDTNTVGLTINGINSSAGVSAFSNLKLTGFTPNNVTTHIGAEFVKSQSLTEAIRGYSADITGAYSTQTNFYAKLTKDLSASTAGYCYYADLATSGSGGTAYFAYFYNSTSAAERFSITNAGTTTLTSAASTAPFIAKIGSSEVSRIDSSGRLLVSTSTARTNLYGTGIGNPSIQVEAAGMSGSNKSIISICNNSTLGAGPTFALMASGDNSVGAVTIVNNGHQLGIVDFLGTDGTKPISAASIMSYVDGTPGANDMPGRLVFSTTADGASSPTERMRITNSGSLRIGQSTTDGPGVAGDNTVGTAIGNNGYVAASRDGNVALYVNRKTNDGDLVLFYQDATQEGTISVSGTTVSYNGAHLSRWSQLPGGATREEILRGTVLSNIDEMCGWGEEDNEQLNRMKVSDVEGDKNVSGVFQCWDDDDETYTDDFYCAMTGDFIIRIAEGVIVERGDLLMSAGDGTAKPQDDDIIRSKTIAKVTSTYVTCTYEDGSYCVPCVLMAC